MSSSFEIFSKNGEILPGDQAVIPLNNIEYSYGFGVYENLRISKGIVYFLQHHVERILHSAQCIGLLHPFTELSIAQWIADIVHQIDAESFNIKMLLIGAKESENATLYIIPLAPLFTDKTLYKKGCTTVTYRYERLFPQAKTLNMLGSYLAYKTAKEAGAYDALLIDRNDHLVEGTRTNLFGIRDTEIISAPQEEILEGVTRKAVLHVALQNGYTLSEGHFGMNDLDSFDGLFITSTSTKILPVRAVDDFQYSGIPEAARELMGLFKDFLEESGGVM